MIRCNALQKQHRVLKKILVCQDSGHDGSVFH